MPPNANDKLATNTRNAEQFMREGLKSHTAFEIKFRQSKENALNAGFHFLSARTLFEHGEWILFLQGFIANLPGAQQISERTIYRYIDFAEEAIIYVQKSIPGLKGLAKIQAAALEMVMQSPKGYVALCRQLGFMRKFGEYDSVKYKLKQLGAGKQLELPFEKFSGLLDTLSRLGDGVTIEFPEGKEEAEALHEIESKLELILQKVRAQIKKS